VPGPSGHSSGGGCARYARRAQHEPGPACWCVTPLEIRGPGRDSSRRRPSMRLSSVCARSVHARALSRADAHAMLAADQVLVRPSQALARARVVCDAHHACWTPVRPRCRVEPALDVSGRHALGCAVSVARLHCGDAMVWRRALMWPRLRPRARLAVGIRMRQFVAFDLFAAGRRSRVAAGFSTETQQTVSRPRVNWSRHSALGASCTIWRFGRVCRLVLAHCGVACSALRLVFCKDCALRYPSLCQVAPSKIESRDLRMCPRAPPRCARVATSDRARGSQARVPPSSAVTG